MCTTDVIRSQLLGRIRSLGIGVPTCGGGPYPKGDVIVDATPVEERSALRTLCEEILTTGSDFNLEKNEINFTLLCSVAGVLLRLGSSSTLAQLEAMLSEGSSALDRHRATLLLVPALRVRLGAAHPEDYVKACPCMLSVDLGVCLPDPLPPMPDFLI